MEVTKEDEGNRRQSDTPSLICLAVAQCQNFHTFEGPYKSISSLLHRGVLCRERVRNSDRLPYSKRTLPSSHLREKEENLQIAEQRDTWGWNTKLRMPLTVQVLLRVLLSRNQLRHTVFFIFFLPN